MNEKKYEITNIAHPHYPWLHRIRALRDVREDVQAGDLGGFVQSEENLSQEGACWIAGNAIVAEEAYVYGNAKLFANAVTGGIPVVMEGATVYGVLGGEIEVRETAVILPGVTIDNPTSDVIHIGPDDIAIERRFKRESPILTPPPGFQPKQHTTVRKRHRGEER